ncbi:hypothetical protein V6N12_024300 [Hibiscus sabdariffa]|uniref:Uncharacterized protein n=1 Tax=Hibiscus sabdariffa TaxID=183260 RepID=A0ABR2G063_9ROSI
MLCSLLHYCRGEHGFEAFGAGRRNNKNLRKGVWEESKKLWKIGFPSILARVTTFGMFIVTQAFIGHIGQLELATYALIQVIVVRFSNVVLLGMSSATETLWVEIGAGRQKMISYVNICSYYVVGVPSEILLGYVAKMEVKGIWIGMIIGVATQTFVLPT